MPISRRTGLRTLHNITIPRANNLCCNGATSDRNIWQDTRAELTKKDLAVVDAIVTLFTTTSVRVRRSITCGQ